MSNIIELYKKNINHNPDSLEIHNLFSSFDLGIFVNYPDCEPFSKLHWENKRYRLEKENMCKEWIIKNKKIDNE